MVDPAKGPERRVRRGAEDAEKRVVMRAEGTDPLAAWPSRPRRRRGPWALPREFGRQAPPNAHGVSAVPKRYRKAMCIWGGLPSEPWRAMLAGSNGGAAQRPQRLCFLGVEIPLAAVTERLEWASQTGSSSEQPRIRHWAVRWSLKSRPRVGRRRGRAHPQCRCRFTNFLSESALPNIFSLMLRSSKALRLAMVASISPAGNTPASS